MKEIFLGYQKVCCATGKCLRFWEVFCDTGKCCAITGNCFGTLGRAVVKLMWGVRWGTQANDKKNTYMMVSLCHLFMQDIFDSSDNVYSVHYALHEIFPFFFRLFWLFFFPLSLISWSTPRGAQFAAPATKKKVVTKMGSIHDLRTPAFLVDLKTLKNNCRVMREKCKSLGVQLRTHMKTHRTK